MEKILLLITCLITLVIIGWNIKIMSHIANETIKIIGSILLSFILLRYLTLIIYAFSIDLQIIQSTRYFYYASSIGITMLTAITVWESIPFLKEKVKLGYFLAGFLPWDVFYIYLIVKQPTKIVESSFVGYELDLVEPFTRYLSIAQGSFIIIIVLLCVSGIFAYKHLQIRTQLFLVILSQGLLVIDGIWSGKEGIYFFKLFTVTEAFALWVIGYVLTHQVKQIKGIKSQ